MTAFRHLRLAKGRRDFPPSRGSATPLVVILHLAMCVLTLSLGRESGSFCISGESLRV